MLMAGQKQASWQLAVISWQQKLKINNLREPLLTANCQLITANYLLSRLRSLRYLNSDVISQLGNQHIVFTFYHHPNQWFGTRRP